MACRGSRKKALATSNTANTVIGVVVALLTICICAVAGYFLVRTLTASDATAVPTQAATAAPSAPLAVDDSWERVEAAGKIVVGTSADYPPFEYYADDSVIDGFDIALMNEIGRRPGVGVEYRGFAFDGLGSALQLNQIDTAIAAISVTSERESTVDFAGVYMGSTGKLCGEPPGIMDQEAANSADLDSAGGYSMEAGQLYIHKGSGTTIIEYVRRDR